ncbi:MAG: sensor histidine kinase [Anaerolineae bacterium]
MNRVLQSWIKEQHNRIAQDTLRKLPFKFSATLLDSLIETLQLAFEENDSEQTKLIQEWMQRHKTEIPRPIHEWATVLSTLKQQIIHALKDHLPAEIVLSEFSTLDKTFTLAMGQIGRIADNRTQADMLDQMIMLKEQISMLEKNRKRFINVAAHELKTPLTLLEGYAKMLRENIEPDDLQTSMYLGGLDNGTDRLRSIINDMIDVSLITSGSFTITRQPLSLDSVLTRVLRGINRDFASRSVAVNIQKLAHNHIIMGDPERLVQAFFKLVSNGVKYTPDGGTVTIDVVPLKTSSSSPIIDIRISDTGVGISNQNLPKIFEPFTGDGDVNLHSSSKTKFMGGGPGLGLPIAKGVIEAHGGSLWVESEGYDSEECPGSVFHVELPILE